MINLTEILNDLQKERVSFIDQLSLSKEYKSRELSLETSLIKTGDALMNYGQVKSFNSSYQIETLYSLLASQYPLDYKFEGFELENNYSFGEMKTYKFGNFSLEKAMKENSIKEVSFNKRYLKDFGGYAYGNFIHINPNVRNKYCTVFHEIGHVYLGHTKLTYHLLSSLEKGDLEVEANLFSYYCLKMLNVEADTNFCFYMINDELAHSMMDSDYVFTKQIDEIKQKSKNFIADGEDYV